MKTVFDCFERVEIIHLPERQDRYRELKRELERCGFDIDRATIPNAPKPLEANGFPSRGVYGNFLSHSDIVRRAKEAKAESVLILEDDAIFSRQVSHKQTEIVEQIERLPWDILYLGHSVRTPPQSKNIFVPYAGSLYWAHCYALKRSVLPRVLAFLEAALERPAGHPLGGRLYIDGALQMFRDQNPDIKCFISSPRLSIQRGSDSSLAARSRLSNLPIAPILRRARDELWRRGMITGGPKLQVADE